MDDNLDKVIVDTCMGIAERYPIRFLEIGTDKDHIHLLIQSVPQYGPTEIVTTVKSITAKKFFQYAQK